MDSESIDIEEFLGYIEERMNYGPTTEHLKLFKININNITENAIMTRFKTHSIPHVVLLMLKTSSSSIRKFIENRSTQFLDLLLLMFLIVDMKTEHSFVIEFINVLLATGRCALIIKCTCIISEPNRVFLPLFERNQKIGSFSLRDRPADKYKSCILTTADPKLSIEQYVSCLLYSCKVHSNDRNEEKLYHILDLFSDDDIPHGIKSMVGAIVPNINKFLDACAQITPELIKKYLMFFDLNALQIDKIRNEHPEIWSRVLEDDNFRFKAYFPE